MGIYGFLSAHRRWSAAGLVVLVAVMMVLALRLDYEEDIARFLPRNEQNERYADVYQQLSNQNRIVISFTGDDTDSIEAALENFANHIETLDTSHVISDLQVQVDETQMLDMLHFVYENEPYFLNEEDWQRIDSLLTLPGYVSEQIADNKRQLQLPTAGAAMEGMRYDPLHLFTPVLNRLQSFKLNDQFEVVDSYVFTRDGRTALAFLTSPYGISESMHNNELQQLLDAAIADTHQDAPTVKISAVGGPLIAVGNANQIKHDSLFAVSISVVLILLLLVWHYRRLQYLWWIAASIAFGWLFAIAGMSLLRPSVSIIVLGIGSVIIGIAVNYPLHYLDHLREIRDRRQTLRDMVPPLLIGNITTVSAFLCLVWLDAAAMRDLGLFGALMLVGTILFVLVVLPLFAGVPSKATAPAVSVPSRQSRRQSPLWLMLCLALTLFLGYHSLHTSFDSDIRNINYMTDDQREGLQLLADVSNDAAVYVVAEGADLEQALQQNDAVVQPVLSRLQHEGLIDRVSGVGRFMPSQSAQREMTTRWNSYWQARRDAVLAELRQAAAREGFSADAFEPFTAMITTAAMPQPQEHFSVVRQFLSGAYILEGTSKTRIVSYVQTADAEAVKQLFRRQHDDRAFAFSSQDISSQLVEILSDSFNYIGFVCGFVVFLFLWLSFGRIELALLSFLPLAVSWIWILGLMHLLGIQFNIVNIILATFIFGQGDDYTIFITEGLLYEYTTGHQRLQSYRRSVILSAVIMFIGIGTLILAKHPALRSLAQVTIVGMGTVVLMAYYLPPLVFRWLVNRPLPLTLKRLAYSLFAIGFFLCSMYLFLLPYTWLYFHLGKATEERKQRYHQLLQRLSSFVIHHVPGVRFYAANRVGETFGRPAVIISNHQSHLDLMCLMMLTPRIVFLTNDWVWHNPFYGMVIHRAEFYPVSSGIENHVEQLRSLYQRGYSICVFPEGTRSEDCSILRFHKGAFYLAEQLQADVLPVFLHGVGHVLPKRDFMLREGRIDVEVGQRIAQDDERFSHNLLERTKQMRHYYQDHYRQMCQRLETDAYWEPYRRLADYYKVNV